MLKNALFFEKTCKAESILGIGVGGASTIYFTVTVI